MNKVCEQICVVSTHKVNRQRDFLVQFISLSIFLLLVISGCGGGSNSPEKVAPEPEVSSFTISESTITRGDEVTLTAVFTGGTATVDNGVGILSSGIPLLISPTETSTYTLSVTDEIGRLVSSSINVTVIATPEISSFTLSNSTITQGEGVTIVAVFSNGTATVDNGVGELVSGVPKTIYPLYRAPTLGGVFIDPPSTTTPSTIHYELTIENSLGKTKTSSVSLTVAWPPFNVSINQPRNGQLVGNDLDISVSVSSSELEISSITVQIEDKLTYLVPDETPGRSGYFIGELSLTDLDRGIYDLFLIAKDVEGNQTLKHSTINLDNKSTITVNEPLNASLANPSISVSASCEDDKEDCELAVSVAGLVLASGVNILSDTLDLNDYDGEEIELKITSKDSSNQITTETRSIFVESSDALSFQRDFTDSIIDFNGEKALLFKDNGSQDDLQIYDLSSEINVDVEVPSGYSVIDTRSYLTTEGVIYVAHNEGDYSNNVYDWNNSLLYDLGLIRGYVSLKVAGDYAIWSLDRTLWLRNLTTKTNLIVSSSAGSSSTSYYSDVADNGVIAYRSSDYEIEQYKDGVQTTLTNDPVLWNTGVLTDGHGFVYRKHYAYSVADAEYRLTYHDGISETVLTNPKRQQPKPEEDYQIENGWVAYIESGLLGQDHIWTRNPEGALIQRSYFGTDSSLESLSNDGDVMFINSGRRYLSKSDGELLEVGSDLGKSYAIDGIWYVTIGRSLLTVE